MGRMRIRGLVRLSASDLARLAGGYESAARYAVSVSESRDRITFRLVRQPLPGPLVKSFPHPAGELRRTRRVIGLKWSLGAYDGGRLVGLALAEPRAWNRSVWVHEFAVAASHRRRGIGTRLMAALARRARAERYRALVCETQSTNAPAIDFYRAVGFRLEGVDVSYYSNEDLERGEVAVFMKRRIPASGRPRQRRRGARRRTSE